MRVKITSYGDSNAVMTLARLIREHYDEIGWSKIGFLDNGDIAIYMTLDEETKEDKRLREAEWERKRKEAEANGTINNTGFGPSIPDEDIPF